MLRPFSTALLIAHFGALFSLSQACFAPACFAEAPSAVLTAFNCEKPIQLDAGQALVEQVQTKFSAVRTLRAQFFQDSYLASVDQSELSSGKVSFLKPGKMKWEYEAPEDQLFIVRDSSLWLFQPRLQQLVVDSLDKVLISQLPTAFLMGVGDLSKDFKLKSACETRSANLLTLSPTAKSNDAGELSSFGLLVDKQSNLPLGAQVIDVGLNRTSILLRALVADDKTIKDADFVFSPPEGIDIDDRRKS